MYHGNGIFNILSDDKVDYRSEWNALEINLSTKPNVIFV